MQTVRNFLTMDHHRCDDLFATAEAAAQQEDSRRTRVGAQRRHLTCC